MVVGDHHLRVSPHIVYSDCYSCVTFQRFFLTNLHLDDLDFVNSTSQKRQFKNGGLEPLP